jgi:formylglycine-generating enzyme required for sulfatase activity
MIGNVWEWTTDWWSEGVQDATTCCTVKRSASACATDPLRIPRRVLKGGSHLCAPNYCRR